ncbi:homeobox protein 2-like isoform X1 [Hermetia illucens]|uniref:homeobox protein 2-like isoform X1 n=2 Tax=Hermetia illucens TaxID=343691 RepID=UPI0018CC1EFA|nr:homeobox protein 2-like isoform X1 [Hermetia illucens]
MFSSDIKIISVTSKSKDGGCNREVLSSSSPSSLVDLKQIKSQFSSINEQKFGGSNTSGKFSNYTHHNRYGSHHSKHSGGNNKHSSGSKHLKKANKFNIASCEKIILNNNNNNASKNQNISQNKIKSLSTNNNNSISINNNILDNNNININNKFKLTPPRTKASLTKINEYLISCSARQTEKEEQDSMVMNNTPKTTQTLTSVATSSSAPPPTSPASYTLDFLHSVGVQMTAGTNRAYLPSASPSRHTSQFVNSSSHRCGGGYSNQEDTAPSVTSATAGAPNINGSHPKSNYKDYISFNSSGSLSANPRNASLSIPTSPSFSYRNAYGYQAPHNYPNHGNRSYNAHIQYHSMGGGSGINSGHTFNGYNRNQVQKKSWGGLNQLNLKKCCNMNMNKYGSVSTSNLGSPQTLPRTRNQQNLRNLTYVHTDSGRIIGNSRSPTPSPKSESPSLYKAPQNLQDCNAAIMQSNGSADQGNSLIATSAPSIDMNNTNGAMNGYESDSSHSSYRHNEFAYRPTAKAMTVSPNFQLGEMPPLINLSALSEDGLKNHAHYYGSHQNLTFWNSAVNSTYSPHSLYSTSGSGSSEGGSQYLGEGNFSQKRRYQSHNRSYRGRRNIYPNFRAHTFHENMFTPPDRFLARAHLVEIKESPETLLNGTKWDQLSQAIWDKFMMSQQREETYRRKMYLWRYLYVTIKKAHPRYGLYLVGSTISGFGADTSDVDMCLVSRTNTGMDARMESVLNLNRLKDYLESTGVFEQFNLIEAKVPILRFRDSMHNLEVDLNFNNCVGIRNTHLLHCYAQLDWRLRPLVLVAKLWAQCHNINNAKNMTISSYSLALMVIHFLQYAVDPPVLPCLHEMYPEKFHILLMSNDFGFVDMNEEIEPYASQNTQTLGELFLQFLEYYSNFDYSQYAISIRTGTVLPIEICRQAKTSKNDIRQWKELCIEEPFDLTNTARSVYDCETFERIKAVFIASWKILQETMDLNAIFSPIVTASLNQVPLNITTTIS